VEVQVTCAGDHLPKLDIRIRCVKEMARAVLNGLDYKLPLSLVSQLITFCVCRINVMTTSSLTGNWCPRVRMTGRKVDFKREYALTFGEYVEARDPKVVSNSMAHRTDPCIALYPTLNANGSWKFYNLSTNKLVSRPHFVKMKLTPENIVQVMNTKALKGMVKASDIDQADPVDIDEVADEPVLVTHAPDPNVVEIIQQEDEDDPEEIVEPEGVDEIVTAEDPEEPNWKLKMNLK